MPSSTKRIKKQHPLSWVVEPLIEESSYVEKPMFGCQAYYLYGRLALVLASKEEPWNGLLIPTDKQFHNSIKKDFKGVVQHPILKEFRDVVQHSVLKKWLYLPEATEDFETVASDIVEAMRMNDQRFGVEPKERVLKRKRKA